MNRLIFSTLTAFTLAVSSQSVHAENLVQAYQHAKDHDAQLKAQETSFLATLENKPQVLSGRKPQISLSGNAAVNQRVELQDTQNSSSFTSTYTLALSKSLIDKNLDAQLDQVDASILQAKLQLEEQRQALILRVAQPYFNYLTALENLRFAEAESKAVEQQLKQVKVFFEVGEAPITDLKETESRYNLALAQEVSAKQSVIDAQENLRVLTGKSYQTLNGPRPNLPLIVPAPRAISAWIDSAKQNNKALQGAKQAIEVARQTIEVQRAARKLKVNLFARQTGNININNSAIDPISLGASVGVEASYPISLGGAIDSRIRQAQHNFRQAQQNYTYQERLVESQVRSAYLSIESSISEVKAHQRALSAAQTAAQASQVGFEVGTRTAIDVLGALRDVFRARSNLSAARYRYLLNRLQLRQAAGTLTEQDLQRMSALLNQPISAGASTQPKQPQISAQKRQQQAQAERKRQHEARQQAQRERNEARRRAHREREAARLRAYRQKRGLPATPEISQTNTAGITPTTSTAKDTPSFNEVFNRKAQESVGSGGDDDIIFIRE